MIRYLLVAGLATVLVAGCGEDKGTTGTTETAATGPESGQASAPAVPPIEESKVRTGVIDHTRDEKEFELRRSIWGVESLISHYKEQGYDTSELEQKKAKLVKELQALLG